jgi:hypothetical protein
MKSVAAALLHLLQLLRPRLLIIIAVALPGEIIFTCKKIGFAEAVDSIVATDNRYSREAYVFPRDALDYTTKQRKKTKGARGPAWLANAIQGCIASLFDQRSFLRST